MFWFFCTILKPQKRILKDIICFQDLYIRKAFKQALILKENEKNK